MLFGEDSKEENGSELGCKKWIRAVMYIPEILPRLFWGEESAISLI